MHLQTLLEQGDFLVQHSLIVGEGVDVVFVILVVVNTGFKDVLFYFIWGFSLEFKVSYWIKNWVLNALLDSGTESGIELDHGLYEIDKSRICTWEKVPERSLLLLWCKSSDVVEYTIFRYETGIVFRRLAMLVEYDL